MMREFDNIKIVDLTILLNEDTTLKRFYPLISIRDMLIEKLLKLDIIDKYMFFEKIKSSIKELSDILDIDTEMLNQLNSLLHLHDFKNRRLSEIKSVNYTFIQSLIKSNIKSSKDYLLICMESNAEMVSRKYSSNIDDVVKLFCLCDLMRLPGVKDTRASLYYDCGYKNLQEFACQNSSVMQNQISNIIASNGIKKSVPLSKELSTQIAVAKILPHMKLT